MWSSGDALPQLFARKEVRSEELAGTELLGTGDIQSLADIGNSVDRIENMKLLPIIGEGRAELSMLPDPRRDRCDTDPRRAASSTRSGLVFDKGQGDSFPHYPIRTRSRRSERHTRT